MLEAVGFTAARDLDYAGRQVIENVLAQVPAARKFVTGGARGGDAYIGRWLREHRPWSEHMVVVPANRSQADPWWEAYGSSVILMVMEPGTTYRDRNATIVLHSSAVFGLPAYSEADPLSQRSGTWQTIRIARELGRMHRWDCVKPPYHGKIEQPLPAGLVQVR
jgi:hypothetical protein